VFHQEVAHDPERAFQQARELYARGGITTLERSGSNNTFAILVRARDARRLGLRSIGGPAGAQRLDARIRLRVSRAR